MQYVFFENNYTQSTMGSGARRWELFKNFCVKSNLTVCKVTFNKKKCKLLKNGVAGCTSCSPNNFVGEQLLPCFPYMPSVTQAPCPIQYRYRLMSDGWSVIGCRSVYVSTGSNLFWWLYNWRQQPVSSRRWRHSSRDRWLQRITSRHWQPAGIDDLDDLASRDLEFQLPVSQPGIVVIRAFSDFRSGWRHHHELETDHPGDIISS